jgi:hypothetical protein
MDANRKIEIVRQVQDLFRAGKWTKGYMARDAEGRECYHRSPNAQSYCLMGALRIVSKPEELKWKPGKLPETPELYRFEEELQNYINRGKKVDDYQSLAGFNDAQHSPQSVIKMLDGFAQHVQEQNHG